MRSTNGLRVPDICKHWTAACKWGWLFAIDEVNMIHTVQTPDLQYRVCSRYVYTIGLVLLAPVTDGSDIGSVDVNSASQDFEIKTPYQCNCCMLLEIDGKLGFCIGQDVRELMSPVAKS